MNETNIPDQESITPPRGLGRTKILAAALASLLMVGAAHAGTQMGDVVESEAYFAALDPTALRSLIETGQPIVIPFHGRIFVLDMHASDIMAPGAKITMLDDNNQTMLELPNHVITFQGHVVGEPATVAALTITDNWVGGAIIAFNEPVFIEDAAAFNDDPSIARKLREHAASGEPGVLHVLYNQPDIVRQSDRDAVKLRDFSDSGPDHSQTYGVMDTTPTPAFLGMGEGDIDPNGPINEQLDQACFLARDIDGFASSFTQEYTSDANDTYDDAMDGSPGLIDDRKRDQLAQFVAPVGYAVEEAGTGNYDPRTAFIGTCDDNPERLPTIPDPFSNSDSPSAEPRGGWSDIRKATIGVVVDREYVNKFGRQSWTEHARKLVNTMSNTYQRDTGIIFQISSLSYDGSLTSYNWGTVLDVQLRTPASGENMVVALLGKDMDSPGEAIGMAQAPCPQQTSAAQMTGDYWHGHTTPNEDFERAYVLMHEVGHNLHANTYDCGHDEATGWNHWHRDSQGESYSHRHVSLMQESGWSYHEHWFSNGERGSIRAAATSTPHNLPAA